MKPRQITEREKQLLQEYANEVMEEITKRAPANNPSATPPAPQASVNKDSDVMARWNADISK